MVFAENYDYAGDPALTDPNAPVAGVMERIFGAPALERAGFDTTRTQAPDAAADPDGQCGPAGVDSPCMIHWPIALATPCFIISCESRNGLDQRRFPAPVFSDDNCDRGAEFDLKFSTPQPWQIKRIPDLIDHSVSHKCQTPQKRCRQ
jgi:hypothetical protein